MNTFSNDEEVAALFKKAGAAMGPRRESLQRALAAHPVRVPTKSPYVSMRLFVRITTVMAAFALVVGSSVYIVAPQRFQSNDQVITEIASSLDASVSGTHLQHASSDEVIDVSLRELDPATYNGAIFESLNI